MNLQLETAYADETTKLNPTHRFVPWVLVNNQPLQEVSPSLCVSLSLPLSYSFACNIDEDILLLIAGLPEFYSIHM